MKRLIVLALLLMNAASSPALLITSVPGPDDQGGMIMPMVTIQANSGTAANPTSGVINLAFTPVSPVLRPLEEWSPGDWFADTTAWRSDLGSPEGVGGTPLANAGGGGLFNNQFGFMFMSMGTMMMANIPTGKSLGIKLTSISSASLESFNYGNSTNRWDEVWAAGVDSQVLWNGSMWHNYYVLPAGSPAGIYTASYEIFIADAPFTGTTGFAQYDAAALAATVDGNFATATVNYSWTVIPEPSTCVLVGVGVVVLSALRRKHG